MRVRIVIAAAAWLPLAPGCGGRTLGPPAPPFVMTIPEDVPVEMTVEDKDGATHTVNGKELYADGYRSGWEECVRQYHAGQLDLTAQGPAPPSLQHYGVVVRGWNDGFGACWRAIRQA